jgi:hypothetical protein
MGVLNIDEYKINDNYILLFLGDIVDREQYSMEILDILFQFINNNKNKIFINRGNHVKRESQNKYSGFHYEIKNKIPNDFNNIYDKINTFFSYCSTAIILMINDKKYWLCHGCVPINKDFINTINDFINSNSNILLLEQKIASQIRWNDLSKINHDTNKLNTKNTNSLRSKQQGLLFSVGLDILNKYLEIFDFIIRGHEDSYANAWLLQNNSQKIF